MKITAAKFGCALLLLGLVTTAPAQSIWNYFISDAGGGNSRVTWTVAGSLATAPGAMWTVNSPFVAVSISAPGIYADAYVADGTAQSIPTLDGSFFQNSQLGDTPISGYSLFNAAGGANDGFALLSSFAATHSSQDVLYNPGTQSIIIPVDFSNFNPGTYQSQIAGFNSPLTVNLTVEPVPEPSTLALLSLGGLGAIFFLRRRAIRSELR